MKLPTLAEIEAASVIALHQEPLFAQAHRMTLQRLYTLAFAAGALYGVRLIDAPCPLGEDETRELIEGGA